MNWNEGFARLHNIESKYNHSIRIIFQKWYCKQNFIVAQYWNKEGGASAGSWEEMPKRVLFYSTPENKLESFKLILDWLEENT